MNISMLHDLNGNISNVIYNRLKSFKEQVTDPEIRNELVIIQNVKRINANIKLKVLRTL